MAHPRPDIAPSLVDRPALALAPGGGVWRTPDGTTDALSTPEAANRARTEQPLVCYWPRLQRRLRLPAGGKPPLDVLELYAFVRPAQATVPTVGGLGRTLGLGGTTTPNEEVALLPRIAQRLLNELNVQIGNRELASQAATLARAGWPWAGDVLAALGGQVDGGPTDGLDVWTRLPEWEDVAPGGPERDHAVTEAEAATRLERLRGPAAEARAAQTAFAEAVAGAFAPREVAGAPKVMLAEAGTGVGKTLGYIAPASVWTGETGGTVWLSTYTKNLQRQIDQELDRLFPDPALKRRKVVLRKGRENYLCLLNFEESARAAGLDPRRTVALTLVARWIRHTRDGDMIGGDLPGWLWTLMGGGSAGPGGQTELTDRRGECIHAACPHYRVCFIERAVRKARRAEFVVANHALVMHQAATAPDPRSLPLRYVFDEGHHLFDAADGAFSAHLSGRETADLRRWIRGAESGRRRQRGLDRRLEDLIDADAMPEAAAALDALARAALKLPAENWSQRLYDDAPQGPTETFLSAARAQVLARADAPNSPYDLEAAVRPVGPRLGDAVAPLDLALSAVLAPLSRLAEAFAARLDEAAESLETSTRLRLDAHARALDRRAETVRAWRHMLRDLAAPDSPADFVDWLSIDRFEGRDVDVGLHRHWLDPTVPFARAVLEPSHGAAITSATLRDQAPADDAAAIDWRAAEMRTGALHLPEPAGRIGLESPFDYAAQTKVVVVRDVRRDDATQVAAAYRALFRASGGGAMGLFTAIRRLRQTHGEIVGPLEAEGLTVYAQHVDPMDAGTLVDAFRGTPNACLLGTDALRDGVDVPGDALRLIVFDRVPWPRRTLLHRSRRAAFGGDRYDDMLVRLKLKQAFGRLVRRAGDTGVFVILDAMTPSRLLAGLPEAAPVHRVGLAEAVELVRDFVGPKT